jgi:hypothetical protein
LQQENKPSSICVEQRWGEDMSEMLDKQKLDDPVQVFGYFLDLALSSDKPIKEEEDDGIQSVE